MLGLPLSHMRLFLRSFLSSADSTFTGVLEILNHRRGCAIWVTEKVKRMATMIDRCFMGVRLHEKAEGGKDYSDVLVFSRLNLAWIFGSGTSTFPYVAREYTDLPCLRIDATRLSSAS